MLIKVSKLRYMEKDYSLGELNIDENNCSIAISQVKKSFLSSKVLPLGQIVFDASTKIVMNGLNIKIGETSFDVETSDILGKVNEILWRPYRVERERKEKLVATADSASLGFLLQRAKAIDGLVRLKANPRETLLESLTDVEEVTDPLTLYHKKLAESLNDPYTGMEVELGLLKTEIDERAMQRIRALIYGIASVQTTLFSAGDMTKPLGLLEKVSSRRLNAGDYAGISLEEATVKLYRDASIISPVSLLGERLA